MRKEQANNVKKIDVQCVITPKSIIIKLKKKNEDKEFICNNDVCFSCLTCKL